MTMEQQIKETISTLLADFVDVKPNEFDMSADLENEYDVDSTEFAELTQILKKRYAINPSESDINHWNSGDSILKFILSPKKSIQ